MASELKVDKIFNAGGDQDSGINLATNDTIKFDIATSTKATMASTGIVTIVGEGGTTTTNLQQGLAKAWVNFSYASTTAVDTFNISSLTDGDVGDFSANFNNNMVNGNFSAPCHGNAINDWHGTETTTISGAASTFRIIHRENNIARDSTYVGSTVHGDLA